MKHAVTARMRNEFLSFHLCTVFALCDGRAFVVGRLCSDFQKEISKRRVGVSKAHSLLAFPMLR